MEFTNSQQTGGNVDYQAVECVPGEVLRKNIKENFRQIDYWAGIGYKTNSRKAHIVSAGNSFREDPKPFFKTGDGADIFAVKHTLPLLKEAGIEPDFCVILDPRPLDENSTHGFSRKDLLVPFKNTVYLVATMSDPGYARYLKEKGCKVVGWHSYSQVSVEFGEVAPECVVGGTCSTTRAISLASCFGYRDFIISGVDCVLNEEQKKKELEKGNPVPTLVVNGIKYSSTPELVLQVKDFGQFFKKMTDHKFEIRGEGPVKDMYEAQKRGFVHPFPPLDFENTLHFWKEKDLK